MTRAFTHSRPPLVWADPGIPGLLVIDRTDDPDALREFERLQRPRSIPPIRIGACGIGACGIGACGIGANRVQTDNQ